MRVWSAATGSLLFLLERALGSEAPEQSDFFTTKWQGHRDCVDALALLPDGRLASGSYDGGVCLWELSSRTCTRELGGRSNRPPVSALAAVEGGRLACAHACADGGYVDIWNASRGREEGTLMVDSSVHALAALPRGLLASCSEGGSVQVWALASLCCVAALQGMQGPCALAALPDGRLSARSGREGGVLCVWELRPQEA